MYLKTDSLGHHEILDDDELGFSFSHFFSDVKNLAKKTLTTSAHVAAKAARAGGNVLVRIEDKAGNITKRVIPGKWANKYIDFASNTVKKGTRGVAHFTNNVLQHPAEIKSIIVHPMKSTSSALTAIDKAANRS
jgi:hypothetical protein